MPFDCPDCDARAQPGVEPVGDRTFDERKGKSCSAHHEQRGDHGQCDEDPTHPINVAACHVLLVS
ncbi:hypothetical protein MTR62_05615 [Novosphingobium sp. 1949]|uniref:Uncharacterized protein n=1 Tax=Novosphingobium organovorum TaxID=2930092 RepID=A0ABT0BAU6_9SPHN|nr:hypothetical protein [Novosphingobium organovorum]MCJ2182177.1 hypothetical protein [Novosphingobium organovorum]